jgi:3-oxoacyl-[acyl-carrier-protein] synthase II
MANNVVITGIGMVTPLGNSPEVVLDKLHRQTKAFSRPSFDVAPFACPYTAAVDDFDAEVFFPENKTLRMMNRDAQMAVVAARLALQDSGIIAGQTCPPDQIALFGATGLTSLPVEDVANLIKYTAGEDGSMDLRRFGEVTLKRVRPVLSFKILANMPICFVSIFENIQGENAIFTPWEGQGAQAIIAGIRAIRRGHASYALVGGCDVKTRVSSFISLQQLGVFDSWQKSGSGVVPGEGAGFLLLEDEAQARGRNQRIYARIEDYRICSKPEDTTREEVFSEVFTGFGADRVSGVIAAGDGDISILESENRNLEQFGMASKPILRPKSCLGNLFAAAAVVQVGLAAGWINRDKPSRTVLANCFGHGSEQAAFMLEGV